MRRAFAETLTQMAADDSRIAFITGDLGFQVFDEFEKRFGKRYVNAGVAEAQMIYTAAGMAIEGWRPLAYSIASFATARPFEQIRYCLAYPCLPVILVGAGRGYLYSTSGVSHHAGDDLGLMSALPGMTVVAPGDPVEVRELLPQLLKLSGPAYFTVGKYGEPTYAAEEPAVLGRARRIKSGERVAILSTGEITNEVVAALKELSTQRIFPAAYQFHTIKPLDKETILRLSREVDCILVVEEHVPQGGLWSAICQTLVEHGQTTKVARLGIPDAFIFGNLKQSELRRRYKIDARAITEMCQSLWSDSTREGASAEAPRIQHSH